MEQNDDRSVEKLMDERLRADGLYRKKIAKDGSCLFRAVAEQVLHCQSLHTRVRAECVKYLRHKRDLYESFIEGDFEEYLHMLQDPQSWVGQVEISALSVLYKHDFIIYQQPGEPPVNITQNGYPNKVLLCFLNGNHYDSVYPISSVKNLAMCQSILYELLYERVYKVDRNVLTPSLRVSKSKIDTIDIEEHESSGDSDLDDGEEFWSSEATRRSAGVNNRTAYKGRGQARGVGRGCLLRKVQGSLNPTIFRNVEYEVWQRSKRVQQRRDFCMAAGMHYKAGDKCQVRLNNTDRFYSAYIQDVSPDDGPVTVFIEELGEKYSVPLWNLRPPDSWSTVSEKSKKHTASSSDGPTEHDTRPGRKTSRLVAHSPTSSSGSASGSHLQQRRSWPTQATGELQSQGKNNSSRRSDQGAGGLYVSSVEENEHILQELLNKDEENFPTLEASAQAASVEGSRRPEKKGSRKKDTKEQSLTPKAESGKQARQGSLDQDQRMSPSPKEEPNPLPSSTQSAPKTTKAARVPYKMSSLSSSISPIQSPNASGQSPKPAVSFPTTPNQSPTAPAPSPRPTDSFQTTPSQSQTALVQTTKPPVSFQTAPIQSPAVSAPSTRPPESLPTTPVRSQIAPIPSTGPQDSLQTTPIQSQVAPTTFTRPLDSLPTTSLQSPNAPTPSTRSIVLFENAPIEFQAALEESEVNPISSQTTPVQTQSLPMPATSILTPVSSQCTSTQCPTVPNPIPLTTSSLPQTGSQTVQSQVSDLTVPVTTPVPQNPVLEATTTPIPPQSTTVPLSSGTTTPNSVSTQLFPPSSSQTTPEHDQVLSESTTATFQGPAASQITSASEVPGSTELSVASQSPPEPLVSAGVPMPVHLPPYPLGTHMPYPLYPPYSAPLPSLSQNISAPMPDPCVPSAVQTPQFSNSAESYMYESTVSSVSGAGGALLPDHLHQQSVTLEQLCRDMLYPGFPQNDKDEHVPTPPFSHHNTGKDLPSDTRVLRFFFNLGVKAYSYPMFPPGSYLAPLIQAYHHMQLKVSPSPVSWQPDNNSRPMFPSPAMEVGMFRPQSLPIASHPPLYPGVGSAPLAGPPLQYSAPPPSVGLQHLAAPLPFHYGMEFPMPAMPPVMDGGHGSHRSLAPQVEKHFWAGQSHSEGGDIKSGPVPVTMEMQHCGGAQALLTGPVQGAEPSTLANGNRRENSSGFAGSSVEEREAEKAEFGDGDLTTGRIYHNQAYKYGARHGQDERGGFRGRGSRGKREYTGWGKHDGQPYHRGSGGRSRGRGYSNPKATGYPGSQFTPVPES